MKAIRTPPILSQALNLELLGQAKEGVVLGILDLVTVHEVEDGHQVRELATGYPRGTAGDAGADVSVAAF